MFLIRHDQLLPETALLSWGLYDNFHGRYLEVLDTLDTLL